MPKHSVDSTRRFIFFDPRGRRWPRLRRRLALCGVLLGCALVAFFAAVWVRPALRLPQEVRELRGRLGRRAEATPRPGPDVKAGDWQLYVAQSAGAQERLAKLRAALGDHSRAGGDIRLGFYDGWDANAVVSLHAHADALTHLAPEWFFVEGPEARLVVENDPELVGFCAAHRLATVPLLRNLSGDTWQPEAVENLARGPAGNRARFIRELSGKLAECGAAGVLVDWDGLDPAYSDEYTGLLAEMSRALHAAHRELWVAISMDEELRALDIDALADHVDHFVALLVDEHAEGDQAGPLASQPWIEGWLQVIAGHAPPEQWVLALGSYAIDWNITNGTAETISFRDAMCRGSYAGVEQDGVKVAAPDFNGDFAYSESGGEHAVVFLDAVSLHNQLAAAFAAGFHDFGLQRVGTEDPDAWMILGRDLDKKPADAALAASLRIMHSDETVTHVGRGEIVTVDLTRDDGIREVTLPDGLLSASYEDFPTYPALYHEGAADPHSVALTFDDGPDPRWTPRVLDVLASRGVKAAFFLVGRNAEDHPDLVRRIVEEGHEIGNHTYTHGNMAEQPEWRMRLELDATERLIESITGHGTGLFRPPYNADSTPSHIEELVPLRFAGQELGYTVVLERIDPQDWARPGAAAIVQRVKEQRSKGNIILLHDAGGDRSQTVEALPHIIDWLRERGDRIVSLGELLNMTRDEIMPPATQRGGWRSVAAWGFAGWHWVVETLWAFMIFATSLVVLRTLLLAWLAWRHRRGESRTTTSVPVPPPPVSVLVAAYNEGRIVEKTLRSVLATVYPGELELVIVDDGSTDDTAAAIERVGVDDARVRLVRQANAGKSAALHNALSCARHKVIVFLDADTLFETETIPALVAELFRDENVAAVSGQARVGNAHNFLTHCQSLEYLCGFNLDRRAYTVWDCVTVVPGAVSAFRREAIEAAGGFSHDTLAEDTDMTLTLHRLGWSVRYAPRAIAWTEAPETLPTLVKQRFRWAFGTMQCLWKHRDLVFAGPRIALGWFSLPGIWFFQILLVALVPPADVVLLWSIFAGYAATFWPYFAAFLAMDLLLASLACAIEREPLRRALLIIPMRFVYRWLLAWVVWKALRAALKGGLVGWGKLERTASVPIRA